MFIACSNLEKNYDCFIIPCLACSEYKDIYSDGIYYDWLSTAYHSFHLKKTGHIRGHFYYTHLFTLMQYRNIHRSKFFPSIHTFGINLNRWPQIIQDKWIFDWKLGFTFWLLYYAKAYTNSSSLETTMNERKRNYIDNFLFSYTIFWPPR